MVQANVLLHIVMRQFLGIEASSIDAHLKAPSARVDIQHR
jgi:hypothetical protein